MQQVHFTANMWEKQRVDGKKKLKNIAIPTIFPNNINEQCPASINVSK